MKRKILIFALCCIMLLGAFSINAFAACENYYYINSFVFDDVTQFKHQVWDEEITFTSNGETYYGISSYSSNCLNFYNSDGTPKIVYSSDTGWIDDSYRTVVFNTPFIISELFYNIRIASSITDVDFYIVSNHDYLSNVINVTCTENGYTTYTCSTCGDTYTDNEIEALGHSYSAVTKEVTCTENGYTIYTCTTCGDTYTDNEIEALGHNYSSSVIDPTCTEEGFTSHTCLTCGDVYTDNTVAPLGHSYSSIVTAPTCTKEGYTTHICSVCNDKLIDTKVEALGHTFDEKMCTVCRAPNPDYYVRARDFASVIANLGDQLKVGPVVSVLVLVVGACVGLVFMWWAVRKLVHALMSAFKKGKISL